jgi:hypothetical protein
MSTITRLAGVLSRTSYTSDRWDIAYLLGPAVQKMLQEAWAQGYDAGDLDSSVARTIEAGYERPKDQEFPTPNPYAQAEPTEAPEDVILRMLKGSSGWRIGVSELIDAVSRECDVDRADAVHAMWKLDDAGKIDYLADATVRLKKVQTNAELWQ